MAHIQFVDELVREYLLYRGFTATVKAFDSDLKVDKDKGFRVDKIVEQILHYINVSDLNGFKEYWLHLDGIVFSKLEKHVQPGLSYFSHLLGSKCKLVYRKRSSITALLVVTPLEHHLATSINCHYICLFTNNYMFLISINTY